MAQSSSKSPAKRTASATGKASGRSPGKAAKPKATPGNDRIASLATRFKATPGGGKPRTSAPSDAATAAAALIGTAPAPVDLPDLAEVEDAVVQTLSPRQHAEQADEREPVAEREAPADASQDADLAAADPAEESPSEDSPEDRVEPLAEPEQIAPSAAADHDAGEMSPRSESAQAVSHQPDSTTSRAAESPAEDDAAASEPQAVPGPVASGVVAPASEAEADPEEAAAVEAAPEPSAGSPAAAADATAALDALVKVLTAPEHSLDIQHDRISKLTLELPIPLVDALNRWELEQVKRTGRRLYRERLVDLAMADLSDDPDVAIARARDLPGWLKYADTEQVGTRVRASVAANLKVLKQEMKMRREKGTYVRHVYAAALVDLLSSFDVDFEEPTS